MRQEPPKANQPLRISLLTILLLVTIVSAAQESRDNSTRKLWNTEFLEHRPQNSTKRVAKARKGPANQAKKAPFVASFSYLGITVWRLRLPGTQDDKSAVLISHDTATSQEWIPEAVSSDLKLSAGDRVRLSVETSRSGYLYVIDRERFADGSLGEPLLISPVTRIRGGNNEVTAGRIIEIPAREDSMPYFTLERSAPNHLGEAITFLLTTRQLDLTISRNPIELSGEQVRQWERNWSKPVSWHNDELQAGRAWSKSEKVAGADATRKLTQKDPLPLTLYRVAANSTEPFCVTIQLEISR
jgi:hypothetical protein